MACSEPQSEALFNLGQVVYDCGTYECILARQYVAGQWWYRFEGDEDTWTPEGMLRYLNTEEMWGD